MTASRHQISQEKTDHGIVYKEIINICFQSIKTCLVYNHIDITFMARHNAKYYTLHTHKHQRIIL